VQKPEFIFRRNGRVHLNRQGRQFSWLLAAEVCASAVVMLDTPCSKVVWRVLATHSIHQFPLQFHPCASPCDGTCAKTRFFLLAKRTSPFKSAGASVQSTTGSRGVRISGSNSSNAGYTMFWGSVKIAGYPLHLSVSSSLPPLCITVCHHISAGLYHCRRWVSASIILMTEI